MEQATRSGNDVRTVAVVGVEFGWGSSGKLDAVLSALRCPGGPELRFVGLSTGLGRPLLSGQPVERWYDLPADGGPGAAAGLAGIVRAERVAAALVVLDGAVAQALRACGVPVVFVDSLPFLWTAGDLAALPLDAEVYCAQRCPELPPESERVLARVRSLRWVESVIVEHRSQGRPTPTARRPWRRALVSFGGLMAPQLGDWASYPRVVLPPVLEALAAHGIREVRVVGNLPASLAGELIDGRAAPGTVEVGPLAHEAFLEELSRCDVLLASPGLTTLLEAGSRNVPTICLPPQNLSQIFNARFHTRALGLEELRVVWPKSVFAEEEALALRADGEGRALELIYAGIAAAAGEDDRETADEVRESLRVALRRAAAAEPDWGALARGLGTGGAAQVADAVLELLRRTPAEGASRADDPCP